VSAPEENQTRAPEPDRKSTLPKKGALPTKAPLPAKPALPIKPELPRRPAPALGSASAPDREDQAPPSSVGEDRAKPGLTEDRTSLILAYVQSFRRWPPPSLDGAGGATYEDSASAWRRWGCFVWLLLLLLLLLLLVGAFLVLHSNQHHRVTPIPRPVPVPVTRHAGAGSSTVLLPQTGGGSIPVKPVRLLLLLSGTSHTISPAELGDLGGWLSTHERAGSQVRIFRTTISGSRLTRPLAPQALTGVPDTVSAQAPTAVRWLTAPAARHQASLAVALGSAAIPPGIPARMAGRVAFERGAPTTSSTAADLAHKNAISAAIALRVIQATGQSLSQPPRLVVSGAGG
jgi:hypothetical protein